MYILLRSMDEVLVKKSHFKYGLVNAILKSYTGTDLYKTRMIFNCMPVLVLHFIDVPVAI